MSKVQVDKVVNLSDDGAPQLTYGAELPVGYGLTGAGGLNITGVVTAASAVFSGNVTIGGTLTYEDVTNIDVVGVSTFAGRMNVNSSALFNEGLSVTAGVTTIAGTSTFAKATTVNATLTASEGIHVTAGVSTFTDLKVGTGITLNSGVSGIVTAAEFNTGPVSVLNSNTGGRLKTTEGWLTLQGTLGTVIEHTDGTNHIKATHGGAAELYYNGTVKLSTSNSGIDVPGTAILGNGSALAFGDNSCRLIGESGGSGVLRIQVNSTDYLRINDAGVIGIETTATNADECTIEADVSMCSAGVNLASYGINFRAGKDGITASHEQVFPITYGGQWTRSRPRAGIGFISQKVGTSENGGGAFAIYTRSAADGTGLTNADERVRVDKDGRVGVGVTTPSDFYMKELVVAAPAEGGITINRGANTGANYYAFAEEAAGGAERYRGFVSYVHNATEANGKLGFGANSSTRAFVHGNGNMEISDGDLVIGTSGHGIDFSAQTASSATGATTAGELLDHYEYGTWTPTIEGQTSAGTATYPQRRGDYTKIGNRVFVNCYISYNSGSGSGNLLIAGLPFSVKNVSACDHVGGTMMSNITISDADDVCSIVPYTGNNLTKVYFYTTRSAATYTALSYDTSGEIIFSLAYNTK